ncbi:hypothetical protein Mp_7g01890 [Marchantia polymorpha subsp. ruderalis]|uniref:Uncharacterized protein n=2 Tax=Marchantia polymorpha TaxID=3197 RepID=A0AAF6BV81_MARPO|nr:hypothetical protein MARPO_0099s0062 [Marchantia polymorpha]BBN15915.1 hypothetical protein Mp_7g01890 [Marchantia polymorpha subsp. ruderalis]|eukprot:PTQ32442.1 hypothetical protein MARPO_0099s0062 [Marchantia polymorpha]
MKVEPWNKDPSSKADCFSFSHTWSLHIGLLVECFSRDCCFLRCHWTWTEHIIVTWSQSKRMSKSESYHRREATTWQGFPSCENQRQTGTCTLISLKPTSTPAASIRQCSSSRAKAENINIIIKKISLGWGDVGRSNCCRRLFFIFLERSSCVQRTAQMINLDPLKLSFFHSF